MAAVKALPIRRIDLLRTASQSDLSLLSLLEQFFTGEAVDDLHDILLAALRAGETGPAHAANAR